MDAPMPETPMPETPMPETPMPEMLARASVQQPIVTPADRHLKWASFDRLEHALMVLCGVFLAGFASSVLFDVITREIGHPWLWLQEVTSAFFTYAIFTGTAVAVRRQDHLCLSAMTEAMRGRTKVAFELFNRSVVLLVGLAMLVFGWQNFLSGFNSFRMPSMTPIAYLYWPIPVCGALVALFALEQIVNGLRCGFVATPVPQSDRGF